MSRRHEATLGTFIGAAGRSTSRLDASPQYLQGSRNNQYVSPTYASNIFNNDQVEAPRTARSRLRTTNKDDFGADIYRNTLMQDRSPARNQDGARSTVEIRSRNENAVDNQRLEEAGDYAPSQMGRSATPSRSRISQRIHPQEVSHKDHSPVPSRAGESRSHQQPPTPQNEHQSIPEEFRQTTLEEQKGPNFYPRYDDEIFARTGFSPDRNKIVYTDKVPNYQVQYTRELPQDPVAVYEQDAKNQLIAIERIVDEKDLKTQVLREEKSMLDDLAQQEESKRLEEKLRRDYRKRIDNYHINQTDNKFYDEKVLRVVKTRGKAGDIKAEAQQVALEKAAENQHIKLKQQQYKAELDQLAAEKQRSTLISKTTKLEAELMHQGLPIGERDRKKYDKEIMSTLRNSIQEKFNFRKKLDQLQKSSNLNDFLAYKNYLDEVQNTLVTQTLKRRENDLSAVKAAGQTSTSQSGSQRRLPKAKIVDKVLVENLAEHDQNVIAFEAAKKEALKHELRSGLEEQLAIKQQKQHVEQKIKQIEGQLIDSGIGSNSYRPLRNYDQKPDITLKSYIKTSEVVDDKVTDRHMVQALDTFDKIKLNEVREIEREKKQYLAHELKKQIQQKEEEPYI